MDKLTVPINRDLFDNSLKENKVHGTLEFPLEIYENNFNDIFTDFHTHWHHEMEIIHVISGVIIVKINHQVFELKENDYIFIHKGSLHSIHQKPNQLNYAKYKTIVFNIDLIDYRTRGFKERTLTDKINNGNIYFDFLITNKSSDYDEINELFHEIVSTYKERKLNYELKIRGLLQILIFYVLNESQNNKAIKQKTQLDIAKAIDLITRNIKKRYTIKNLADILHYSESHLMRKFKKNTGMTIINYINNERIKHAKDLLLFTDKNINYIAEQCGFEDDNYFIRVFKKQLNMTPKEFRNKYQK